MNQKTFKKRMDLPQAPFLMTTEIEGGYKKAFYVSQVKVGEKTGLVIMYGEFLSELVKNPMEKVFNLCPKSIFLETIYFTPRQYRELNNEEKQFWKRKITVLIKKNLFQGYKEEKEAQRLLHILQEVAN